jgi:hypothetical protein
MRMARLNVYVPNDLAAAAREAGLNVSGLTQEAIRSALASQARSDWLAEVMSLPSLGLDPEVVEAATAEAKDEWEGHG